MDAKFEGPPFPDSPAHDLEPRNYFDMFFGHELIETISEQTDLHSVQTLERTYRLITMKLNSFLVYQS